MTARRAKAKPTVWREAKPLLVNHRAKYTARRGTRGQMLLLEVALWKSGVVIATITHVVQPEGRHATLSDWRWPVMLSDRRVVEATIAVAQRWCEARANEIVAAANSLASLAARKARR